MKSLVILNGVSRKRDYFLKKIYPTLQSDLAITEYSGHAEELARASDHEVIYVAGGDGTMSQVVNGVIDKEKLPGIGLIPLGSGNDLARSLMAKSYRSVDVGKVTLNGRTRYFINECSIGMGPEVVKRIEGSKNGNAALKYTSAILKTFLNHKPEPIEIKSGNYHWRGDARVLAVANGKAFGHSIYIAPDAEMDDGRLNMFLVKGLPLMQFLFYLQSIKTPKKIDAPKWLEYRAVEHIEVTSPEPLPVEADGELIGETPYKIEVAEKKLRVFIV